MFRFDQRCRHGHGKGHDLVALSLRFDLEFSEGERSCLWLDCYCAPFPAVRVDRREALAPTFHWFDDPAIQVEMYIALA